MMIESKRGYPSISRQCELLGVSRSGHYRRICAQPSLRRRESERVKAKIDRIYTECPFFGSRQITLELRSQSEVISRKRVQRLMREMGLQAICPKPNTSKPHPEHKIYPYLLRNVAIERVDQVWSTDITYIPMSEGHVYLCAVMDWKSRYVISWSVSCSMDGPWCRSVLQEALLHGSPEVFNTDQGSQFTSPNFVSELTDRGIKVSMDGRGRALDNVFVERLWRTVKYENVYLKGYENMVQLKQGLKAYFEFYNKRRRHSSLDAKTPAEVYESSKQPEKAA
ncbi:MAG: IS3 family transposase [Verrucomicrobiia bacterium]|jgi:putative transposase|tara:strand:- start:76 stop:918 length:843 start_codon:yes stop_codon:yes gene_type:complete